MVTRFYLNDVAAPYTPATLRGSWDQTASAVTKRIDPSRVGSASVTNIGLARTGGVPWKMLLYRGVSGPLGAQTIAGNFNVCIGMRETAATADAAYRFHIYVTQGDSDTPRGTLLSGYTETAEFTTTALGQALASSQALSSLAISAGDRIVVEIGANYAATSSTASTVQLNYGGGRDAPDSVVGGPGGTEASWIEFDTDLVGHTESLQVSQTVAEVLIQSSVSPALQVSQTVEEVLIKSSVDPALQISQTVLEVLIHPVIITTQAQASQVLVEPVVVPATPSAQTSQVLVEPVVVPGDPSANASQALIEVAVANWLDTQAQASQVLMEPAIAQPSAVPAQVSQTLVEPAISYPSGVPAQVSQALVEFVIADYETDIVEPEPEPVTTFSTLEVVPTANNRYGGVIEVTGNVFYADIQNTLGAEIPNIETGLVRWSADALVPSTLEMSVRDLFDFVPYRTLIAPFMTVSYIDALDGVRVTVADQLGLFTLLPVKRDHVGASTAQSMVGYDIVWLLAQRSTAISVVLSVGSDPIAYIRTKLDQFGFRHRLTSTSHTLVKEFTWRPGTAWITIFNDLLNAIGYYQLWSDRTGVLVSMPIRALVNVESQAEFSTEFADVGEHVSLEPDQLHIRNDIIVIGNSPTNDPIVSRRTNVDGDSPVSIFSLRSSDDADPVYLTLVEDDSGIETQAAADAIASRLLEERSSLLTRLEIEVVPRPGIRMREPVSLYIESDAGHIIADGKWWWDEMTVKFTDETGGMSMRLNKLIDLEVTT